MPPKGGAPKENNSYRTFLLLIGLFALVSFGFLWVNSPTLRILPKGVVHPVNIILWNVKDPRDTWGTFLGASLIKNGTVVNSNCGYCTFTTDRSNLHLADAVVFDPTALDYDEWRRIPITLPYKQPYQQWVMTSYQHHINYPLTTQPVYTSFMDLHMTYKQDSHVPVTLFCPWGDSFRGPEDLLSSALNHEARDKTILFISSNCQFSGASARTSYVAELMKHIKVDSYGACLPTATWDGQISRSTFENMEEKIKLMKQYKIVLAFENNNVTDYVTEKVFNAFQAGALPIYMGAPNIDDWLPGPRSVVKTDDFNSPKDLATYLNRLLTDPSEYNRYFEWKKGKIAETFVAKFQRCLYNSACRLCEEVAEKRTEEMTELKQMLVSQRPTRLSYAVRMDGTGQHVKVRHHKRLCVTDRYTIMAWVKPESFGDQRVVDKNKAGRISGYNFDIQRGEHSKGFIRLCAGESCFMAKKAIYKNTWSHVAVVYSSEHASVFENHVDFYINGVLDHTEIVFAPTNQEMWYDLSFGKPANVKDTQNGFHGSMDNIAMFDRDLSGEEILHYMYNIPVGDEPGLLGWWTFDEEVNEQYVHDLSIYEYDGELEGPVREPSLEKPLHIGNCQ